MIDEDLRALEKAVASEPSVANRWRYAKALERAGRRREHSFVLCELARAGDATARDAVWKWNPWSAREGAAARRRALEPGRARRVTTHRLELAWPRQLSVLAATDRALYAQGSRGDEVGLVTVASGTTEVLWTADLSPEPAVALAGDDVVLVHGQQLIVRDGHSGEKLSWLAATEPIRGVHAAGATLLLDHETSLAARTLGIDGFGGELWRRQLELHQVLALGTDHVLLRRWPLAKEEALELASGRTAWTFDRLGSPEPGTRSAHAIVRGAGREALGVLAWELGAGSRPIDTVFALELATGFLAGGRLPPCPRQERVRDEWFDTDGQVLAIGRQRARDPDWLDRPRGVHDDVVLVRRMELSDRAPFPTVGEVVARPRDLLSLALAEEALYVLSREEPDVLELIAVDVASGRELFRERFDLPYPIAQAWVIPVAGMLVLAVRTDYRDELFLVKIASETSQSGSITI